MKRVWPIIAVSDVAASAEWHMNLLGARQTHPGGATFDQIVDDDGTGKPTFVIRDPDGYHVAINESWAEEAA